MTDDTTQQPAETPENGPAEQPEKHSVKADFRGALGKVAGIAVEAGSMLAGNAGAGVSAEGEVAEHETEELIDRIDGED